MVSESLAVAQTGRRDWDPILEDEGLPAADRVLLTVEVSMKETSAAAHEEVERCVRSYLSKRSIRFEDGPLRLDNLEDQEEQFLSLHVQEIQICDTEFNPVIQPGTRLMAWQTELSIHVFQLNDEEPADAEGGDDEATPAYSEWQLPAQAFCGLWESLVYGQGIKQKLLQYASTALQFGQQGVNPHLVSFNRTVLLHGPPGTGKTSLCKALAQKLAIRFSHRFANAQLIEVNAHSLFSKWFSESGKLVTALFARIKEAVDEEDTLVFVLIDEVESLTAARKAAVSGSEPADAVRAVNALLTALDSLKNYPNVMLLTTSNITEAIDAAFLDRVDIKAYLGPPELQARYHILRSCIIELQRAQIISSQSQPPPPFEEVSLTFSTAPESMSDASTDDLRNDDWKLNGQSPNGNGATAMHDASLGSLSAAEGLQEAAEACEGLSGRVLRKLPFLAHVALAADTLGGKRSTGMFSFLAALKEAAIKEACDRKYVQ